MKKVIAVALLSSLLLAGCGEDDGTLESLSKKELIAQHIELYEKYSILEDEKFELETTLAGVGSAEIEVPLIKRMSDGTNRKTFTAVNGEIEIPGGIGYPEATQYSAEYNIELGDGVKVSPSSNWIIELEGGKVTMEHADGISCSIMVGEIDDMYTTEELKEFLVEKLNNIPPMTAKISAIFVGEDSWGVNLNTPTLIDGEASTMRIGLAGMGDVGITYCFIYRGEKSSTKEEYVDSVINSISILGNKCKVK